MGPNHGQRGDALLGSVKLNAPKQTKSPASSSRSQPPVTPTSAPFTPGKGRAARSGATLGPMHLRLRGPQKPVQAKA